MSAYYLKREPLNFGSLFDFIADGFFLCSEAGFVVGYGKGQKKSISGLVLSHKLWFYEN